MRAMLATLMAGTLLVSVACNPSSTQQLATASDTVAHALTGAQQAVKLGVTDGVISPAEDAAIEPYFAQVGQAGLALDQAIRTNASATTVSAELNTFLAAFNGLVQNGVGNIKDAKTKLEISTILTGAEAAIAVIGAAVGNTSTPSTAALKPAA